MTFQFLLMIQGIFMPYFILNQIFKYLCLDLYLREVEVMEKMNELATTQDQNQRQCKLFSMLPNLLHRSIKC